MGEEPYISPHLIPYWEAFHRLNVERGNSGFGPLPIKISEILAECQVSCLDNATAASHIRSMDNVFLDFAAKKMKDSKDKQVNKPKLHGRHNNSNKGR